MRHKIIKIFACVCVLVFFTMLSSHREFRYTPQRAVKILDEYQSQLEEIAKYMINESPNGRYLDVESSEDNYLNCLFIPQTIKDKMRIYFDKIVSQGVGSIYVLREDTQWYWHLPELPNGKNVVSFALYIGSYAVDHETGNEMTEYQMLYYSDMNLNELQALLNSALIHDYEVLAVKENWFLATVR